MPLKLGNGGNGLEEYNEHDGKYKTDGIPNKSYDNPNEQKILDSLGLENTLVSTLNKVLRNSSTKEENVEKIKNIINNIEDSEYKELLLYFYNSKNCKIDIGNYSEEGAGYSPYSNVVELDYNDLDEQNGKVFFHENGHAIDQNFGENGKQISDNFVGSEGLNLYDSIFQDWQQTEKEIFEYYEKYQEDFIKKEFEKNNLKYSSEKEQKRMFENEKEKQIENIQKQQEELIKKFRELSKGLTKEQQLQNKQLLDLDIEYKNLIQQKSELQSKEFEPIIPTSQETILLVDSLEKVQNVFENISDVVSSMRQGSPLTNKGHPKSYWKLPTNINSEFFANSFQSLISNNKEEIKLYEKFFPKSFKVAKEILQELINEMRGKQLYAKFNI